MVRYSKVDGRILHLQCTVCPFSLLPLLRSYVSPTQTPCRNMSVDIPAPKASPHLHLNTHNFTLNNRPPSPPRHTWCATRRGNFNTFRSTLALSSPSSSRPSRSLKVSYCRVPVILSPGRDVLFYAAFALRKCGKSSLYTLGRLVAQIGPLR
jgi:hypothetical protein